MFEGESGGKTFGLLCVAEVVENGTVNGEHASLSWLLRKSVPLSLFS